MSSVVLVHPLPQSRALELQIAARGYHAVYRLGLGNHCPGCGRSNWWVGRSVAECAFCATALPIVTHRPGKDL